MKVQYSTRRSLLFGIRKTYFSDKTVEPCCDEMRAALRDHFIQFGEYDAGGCNESSSVNIFKCSPYPEGAAWEDLAISFCPFCGVKIECDEVTEEAPVQTIPKE
jgi:hypothetical protein